jgi:hypothetical protein
MDQKGNIAGHSDSDMPGVALAAELTLRYLEEGQSRNDGDPMVADLTMISDVDKSGFGKDRGWKLPRRTFGFLQAKDVEGLFLKKAQGEACSKPN